MVIRKHGWTLYRKGTDTEVYKDQLLWNENVKDADRWVIEGGEPPLHTASSGRVWVRPIETTKLNRTFFPHVFDLEWRLDNGS